MKLSELGEGGLLDLFREWTAGTAPGVVLGAGDDAAILELPGRNRHVVVSTDAWREGVHFTTDVLSPDEIGHRCMAGSLSDLAAMGAEGIAAFVNLHAPPDLTVEFLRSLYKGMGRVADSCGVSIAGGDTVRGELALGITVIGQVAAGRAIRRDGARDGDVICVSGTLGRSEAGRRLLAGDAGVAVPRPERAVAETGHKAPAPRFDVSRLLMSLERRTVSEDLEEETMRAIRPTAMIDVSDGLAPDLRRVCMAGSVGCRVEEAKIPVDRAARRIAEAQGDPACALALSGGEDFELLFTMAADDVDVLHEAAAAAKIRIAVIGCIAPAREGLVLTGGNGEERPLPDVGWDHFRPGPTAPRE